MTPPDLLLHGTAERFLESILREGLSKQNRRHAHLSDSQKTALSAGAQYGKPVLLKIDSKLMHEEGFEFFETDNDVWLVDAVPNIYLTSHSGGAISRIK